MSESRVTWATSVPILVFLGLSLTDVRRASSLNAPYPRGGGIKPKECASSAGDNKQNVRRVQELSGNLRANSAVFSRLLNVGSDGEEVTSAGRVFPTRAAATGKARIPYVASKRSLGAGLPCFCTTCTTYCRHTGTLCYAAASAAAAAAGNYNVDKIVATRRVFYGVRDARGRCAAPDCAVRYSLSLPSINRCAPPSVINRGRLTDNAGMQEDIWFI